MNEEVIYIDCSDPGKHVRQNMPEEEKSRRAESRRLVELEERKRSGRQQQALDTLQKVAKAAGVTPSELREALRHAD